MEETQDFVLTEKEYDKFKDLDIKTTLDELQSFDFSSDDELKLDEFSDMVNLLDASQNPTAEKKAVLQFQEAENVITREGENFLGKEVVDQIEKEKSNLMSFLRKYEVNTDVIKNMSEPDKDKLYGLANFLFNNFQKIHNNLIFKFPLSQEEYKFLNEVITKKLEYDRDGVFQIQELKDKYLSFYQKFIKDAINVTEMTTVVDINSLMILYHHLTRYSVKGAQTEAGLFFTLIQKMEARLMLYNAYKIITDRLSENFRVWGGALTIDEIGLKVTEDETLVDEILENENDLKIVDEKTGLVK
jgi:hypothetical protein